MQELIHVDGRRLSYKTICEGARMTRRSYAEVKRGDNKNMYAYYAVFRIYLHTLVEQREWRTLRAVLQALHKALEEDHEARHRL